MDVSDAPDQPPISTRVMEIMTALGEPITVQRISDVIEGATARQVANCVSQMKQRGLVEITDKADIGIDQIPRARWRMTRSGEQHFARAREGKSAGPPPPPMVTHSQNLARVAAVKSMVHQAVQEAKEKMAPVPTPVPAPRATIVQGVPMIGAGGDIVMLHDGVVECVIPAAIVERISKLYMVLGRDA